MVLRLLSSFLVESEKMKWLSSTFNLVKEIKSNIPSLSLEYDDMFSGRLSQIRKLNRRYYYHLCIYFSDDEMTLFV